MHPEQEKALRNLLSAVIPKGRLTPGEIDALVLYMAEVAKTEDEAIQRLSGILQNDLNGIATWKTILQVELLREKIGDHQDRLRILERNEKSDYSKWPMVQAIFTAISFIAATMALLKAFGLLQLPWLL
jgi:ABC-type multidrug transport system fused ATPase/permease subunit